MRIQILRICHWGTSVTWSSLVRFHFLQVSTYHYDQSITYGLDYDEVKLTSLLLNWKEMVKYKLTLRLGGHKLGTNLVEERKLGINPATAALLPSQSPIQQTNLDSKSIISEIFDYFEGCGSTVGGCGSVVDFL